MIETMDPAKNTMEAEIEASMWDFKVEEAMFKEDITNNQSPKEKKVEKLWNNTVRFPYEYNQHECTLLLEKRWDMVFVKLEWMPIYMWEKRNHEFELKSSDKLDTRKAKEARIQYIKGKEIDASSFTLFSEGVGTALNEIVSGSRKSVPDKAKEAYKLLWFTNKKEK